MTWSWFHHPRLEQSRSLVHAGVDRLSFVLESAAVAVVLFWLLTWAACSFDWQTVTHEWGSFWTHYAKASPASRLPVERFIGASLAILTALTAAIRLPKARMSWAAWPTFKAAPSCEETFA